MLGEKCVKANGSNCNLHLILLATYLLISYSALSATHCSCWIVWIKHV